MPPEIDPTTNGPRGQLRLGAALSRRLAIKRLAAVEVNRSASNQRELNAGQLRTQLGFDGDEVRGSLHVLNYREGPSPTERIGAFAIYDARRNTPPRKEYRLYFSSELIRASEGDLLILFRMDNSNDLGAVIAESGSDLEEQLVAALELGDQRALNRLVFRDAKVANEQQALAIIKNIAGTAPPDKREYDVAQHPLVVAALAANELPSTAVMAGAAAELVRQRFDPYLDPDSKLAELLEAETALFKAMQKAIGNAALSQMAKRGELNLTDVAAFVMRLHQSAKSRRGYSLQNHFELLLKENDVPYKAQATTERDERPDFLFPGEAQYRDAAFSARRLRMVAAKSRVRERWKDVLEQADRIDEKYFLTVDENMAEDKIRKMRSKRLRIFMPRKLIRERYAAQVSLLEDVGTLINELRAASEAGSS